tara:strand:- start:904 stop:1392 length:489 start_codon:yes stop_codon:yes gene_type:complete
MVRFLNIISQGNSTMEIDTENKKDDNIKKIDNTTNLMSYIDDNKDSFSEEIYIQLGKALMNIQNKHNYFRIKYTQLTVIWQKSGNIEDDNGFYKNTSEVLSCVLNGFKTTNYDSIYTTNTTICHGKIPIDLDETPYWTVGTVIHGESGPNLYIINEIDKIVI